MPAGRRRLRTRDPTQRTLLGGARIAPENPDAELTIATPELAAIADALEDLWWACTAGLSALTRALLSSDRWHPDRSILGNQLLRTGGGRDARRIWAGLWIDDVSTYARVASRLWPTLSRAQGLAVRWVAGRSLLGLPGGVRRDSVARASVPALRRAACFVSGLPAEALAQIRRDRTSVVAAVAGEQGQIVLARFVGAALGVAPHGGVTQTPGGRFRRRAVPEHRVGARVAVDHVPP